MPLLITALYLALFALLASLLAFLPGKIRGWNGASATTLHAMGALMLFARVMQVIGFKAGTIQSVPRGIGAGGTFLLMIVAA